LGNSINFLHKSGKGEKVKGKRLKVKRMIFYSYAIKIDLNFIYAGSLIAIKKEAVFSPLNSIFFNVDTILSRCHQDYEKDRWRENQR
jgi:hypothetical protein